MKLETDDASTELVTPGDIASAISGLVDVGEAFIVLSDGEHKYVQAAGTVGEAFIVEYRSGGPGDHYRGDRRASADELTTMLVGYLRRETAWNSVLTWHRVLVDQERLSA